MDQVCLFSLEENENAPRAAEDTNLKMSWEEIAKFSRYRIELAAFRRCYECSFYFRPRNINTTLLKKQLKYITSLLVMMMYFKEKMKLSRNLQGLLTDSRILGIKNLMICHLYHKFLKRQQDTYRIYLED